MTETVEIIEITPEMATEMLGHNTGNRNIKASGVRRYVDDIENDRWIFTGDSIRFDSTGRLLDGQHRLTAIVRTGRTMRAIVIRGLDPKAQEAMDLGIGRSTGDLAGTSGDPIPNVATATAIAVIALAHESGSVDRPQSSKPAQLEWLRAHREEVDAAVRAGRKVHRQIGIPPAVAGYAYLVMSQISVDDADAFWRDATDLVGLRKGDPVLALVQTVNRFERGRHRLRRSEYLSLIYRAWNARRGGKDMSLLRLNSGSGSGESIPAPTPI